MQLSATGPPPAPVAFQAEAYDAYNNKVANPQVTWTVVNGGGTIDATGLFTAGSQLGVFTNTVKATASGKSATATVRIERGVTLPAGYQLAAMPGSGGGVDAAQFFQTSQVARWQAATQQWSTYATQPFTLTSGEGYAVLLTAATEVGVTSVLENPLALPLAGMPWNLIGNPYLQSLVWDLDALTYSVNGSAPRALRTLVGDASRPLEFSAWLRNPAAQSWELLCDPALVPGARSSMSIAEGGWIAAYRPGVQLTLPYSDKARSVSAPPTTRGRTPGETEWAVKLQPRVEGATATPAWLGCSSQFGRAGFRLTAPPPLGTTEPYVLADLSGGGADGAPLAIDLRSS
ncbi:MAG: hypothetical protein GW802_34740, partial [Armatimonadetes bacterium]|nr:hypothetical protein [Armatimonadota bacterium]